MHLAYYRELSRATVEDARYVRLNDIEINEQKTKLTRPALAVLEAK